MIIRNVSADQILQAANAAGGLRVEIASRNLRGTAHNVKLYPAKRGDWQKQNPLSGRKIAAVNYYGFRAFFRELFKIAPDAVARTMVANFDGAADFRIKLPDLENRNFGSEYYPHLAEDECVTDENNLPI